MDRDLEFRGLRLDGRGWVFGLVVKRKSKYFIEVEFTDLENEVIYRAYEVYPETIGQFTGRTDSRGVKIFEGDKMLHGQSPRFVEYRWSNFVLTTFDKKKTILLSFSPESFITGNIHEEKGGEDAS